MTRALYSWLLRLAFPYVCLRVFWRGLRNRDYWRRIPERFGFIEPLGSIRVIWVHAVSVGEVRAAAPLVQALCERYPDHRIVLTAMTPTGSATARSLFGDRVTHGYVPYDYPSVVNRFLDRTHPALVLILEKNSGPTSCTSVVNVAFRCAWPTPSSARVAAAAGAASARSRRLLSVRSMRLRRRPTPMPAGSSPPARAETVHVVGLDQVRAGLSPELPAQAAALRRDWGAGRPAWLAASTHEGEETEVLRAHAVLKARFPGLLLVLAPRHPERFDAVVRLCERAGLRVARRSDVQEAQVPQARTPQGGVEQRGAAPGMRSRERPPSPRNFRRRWTYWWATPWASYSFFTAPATSASSVAAWCRPVDTIFSKPRRWASRSCLGRT